MQDKVIGKVQVQRSMDRPEGERLSTSVVEKDYTVWSEEKAKLEEQQEPRTRCRLRAESNL